MKKLFTISSIFTLALCSQTTLAQEKKNIRSLTFKSDKSKKNVEEKTTIYEGNVMMKDENISFENAEKVVYDPENGTYTIYHPKNFKILAAKSVHKTGKREDSHVIIYNYKEESVTF
ncbi:hypothetical protein OF897_13670 [Chryseobacterium formosus]|uniref:OstA-like protein n=1 Tax=Chryseobacterium formosus TaxID=1537363 RepID=A0ABT3XS67_9FLAO|nr:hypothetical protein [Chryseobacterium formosus]MCX8524962.1 hypothetical protein [Chryseobacterium formosus]